MLDADNSDPDITEDSNVTITISTTSDPTTSGPGTQEPSSRDDHSHRTSLAILDATATGAGSVQSQPEDSSRDVSDVHALFTDKMSGAIAEHAMTDSRFHSKVDRAVWKNKVLSDAVDGLKYNPSLQSKTEMVCWRCVRGGYEAIKKAVPTLSDAEIETKLRWMYFFPWTLDDSRIEMTATIKGVRSTSFLDPATVERYSIEEPKGCPDKASELAFHVSRRLGQDVEWFFKREGRITNGSADKPDAEIPEELLVQENRFLRLFANRNHAKMASDAEQPLKDAIERSLLSTCDQRKEKRVSGMGSVAGITLIRHVDFSKVDRVISGSDDPKAQRNILGDECIWYQPVSMDGFFSATDHPRRIYLSSVIDLNSDDYDL